MPSFECAAVCFSVSLLMDIWAFLTWEFLLNKAALSILIHVFPYGQFFTLLCRSSNGVLERVCA